jgi:hypothetical protein
MASFSLDPTPYLTWIPDVVRSWLPWQWRPSISNWLVWSAISFAVALLCLLCHFLFREKQRVDWFFLKGTGVPIAIGWERSRDGTPTYRIEGVQLNGINVSGHALQVHGEITLDRDQRKLPLFIVAEGQWVATDDVESVPPEAIFNLGASFRGDLTHWPGFEKSITPEQFLQDFGGFTAIIFVDGVKQTWSFSIDQLRRAIESFERFQEDQWLSNPSNRPFVKRR